MTPAIELRIIDLPDDADEASPRGEVFRELYALRQRQSDARLGTGIMTATPRAALVGFRSSSAELTVLVGAWIQGRLVAHLIAYHTLKESTDVADSGIVIDPALDHADAIRIAEALTEYAHQDAAARGRTTLMGGSPGAATGAITAATGFGSADLDDPEAMPLIARGYTLEQVYRFSVAHLEELPDLNDRFADATGRSEGYELVEWTGATPQPYRAGMIALHERMSTDAPIGDLALDPEVWDDERLTEFETRHRDGGRTILTVAARRRGSDELAGFSTLFVPDEGDVAPQHDTLVAGPHRGHGLGMLLKLANLVRVRDDHSQITRVTTWNAEENRPMLDVNEAVGFRPQAYEAVWQLKLKDPS